MISEKIKAEVDKGRLGKNQGISIGLPNLENIIDGVTQETYTLVMSNSGSGKTTFALWAYVYKPIMAHLGDDNYKVLYFSLEMSEIALYVKLMSLYIFDTYHIQLSYKEILSKKKNYILSDEMYKIVQEAWEWADEVEKHLEIYDKHVSANTIYAALKSRLESLGKFEQTENRMIYIPNNPDLFYVVILDHIGLLTTQPGNRLKDEIDLASKYLLTLRDKCRISPVVVQQANRDQGNIERFKAGKSAFTINDVKDSGNTVQDCNIMLALYNPGRDGLNEYHKYQIPSFNGNFRSIMVLKDRYGASDCEDHVAMYGNVGFFKELPNHDQIYDYEMYGNADWIFKEQSEPEQPVDNLNIDLINFD